MIAINPRKFLSTLLCAFFFATLPPLSFAQTQPLAQATEQVSEQIKEQSKEQVKESNNPKVNIKTSMGNIVVELYPEKAPKTVANFIAYVKSSHYSKTIFHRVIDHFMIQGGGYDVKLKEKSTRKPVVNEAQFAFEHGLRNEIGTIVMARTNDPNSARAQFFINAIDNAYLDYQAIPDGNPVEFVLRGELVKMSRKQALSETAGYTPFGKVIEGMDIVNKIKTVKTETQDRFQNVPINPIVIESIKILK
jgi:peptidyl-prolyl cis-trans isomerase A (cyclophilin A)